MLETRRAEDALERIKAWTGDNYEATTIADAVKLDKYIRECLETADNLNVLCSVRLPQVKAR